MFCVLNLLLYHLFQHHLCFHKVHPINSPTKVRVIYRSRDQNAGNPVINRFILLIIGVFGMNSYEIIMIVLTATAVIIDLIKLNNGNKK